MGSPAELGGAPANGTGGLEEVNSNSLNSMGLNSVQQSFSSMSSTTSNSMAFNRIIKDFKKALGERKTPKSLVFLNRIMIIVLTATLILSSLDFGLLQNEIENLNQGQDQNLRSQRRNLKFIQLATNVRSMINIANGLEFQGYYDDEILRPIDRYEYLSGLVQDQASELQEIHEQLIIQSKKQQDSEVIKEYEY